MFLLPWLCKSHNCRVFLVVFSFSSVNQLIVLLGVGAAGCWLLIHPYYVLLVLFGSEIRYIL